MYCKLDNTFGHQGGPLNATAYIQGKTHNPLKKCDLWRMFGVANFDNWLLSDVMYFGTSLKKLFWLFFLFS